MRPLLTLLLLLAACHEATVAPFDVPAFLTARARWRAAGIAHYRYESTYSCFCPPQVVATMTVEYRDGVRVDARYADGTPVPEAFAGSRPPIDSLLTAVLRQQPEWVARIEATYDAQYGYPRTLSVITKPTIADGGFARTITRFEVLP